MIYKRKGEDMMQITPALSRGYGLGTSDGRVREGNSKEKTPETILETSNATELKYNPALPSELDIFSDLPGYVVKNLDAYNFLNWLRISIQKAWNTSVLDNITLSKLVVSEYTESGITIDWIYNYFRVYFSFDLKEGNYVGEIMYDKETGEFSSKVEKMCAEDYKERATAILEYVISMLK